MNYSQQSVSPNMNILNTHEAHTLISQIQIGVKRRRPFYELKLPIVPIKKMRFN